MGADLQGAAEFDESIDSRLRLAFMLQNIPDSRRAQTRFLGEACRIKASFGHVKSQSFFKCIHGDIFTNPLLF